MVTQTLFNPTLQCSSAMARKTFCAMGYLDAADEPGSHSTDSNHPTVQPSYAIGTDRTDYSTRRAGSIAETPALSLIPVVLDSARVGRDAGRIADEVILILSAL